MIFGEIQLKQTKLKSLGLTQGRAAMKLVVKSSNVTKGQAFVEALNLKKPSNLKTSFESNQTMSSSNEVIETSSDSKRLRQTEHQIIDGTNDLSKQSTEMNKSIVEEEVENTGIKSVVIEDIREKSDEMVDEVQDMEVESEESSDDSEQVVDYLSDSNNEILFKMSDLPKVSKLDFPDEFYETTKDDLVTVLNGLRRQQVGKSGKLLETKQMQEKKRVERIARYKSTVIRICFPNDRLVFQAIFKPNDTIKTVMQGLANYVDLKDFYLYTVPPKRILSSDSTLYDSGLVPAAVLHFGTNGNDSRDKGIRDQFKQRLTSYKIAAKIAIDSRKQINECNAESTGSLQSSTSSVTQTTDTTNTRKDMDSNDNKKIPKWFKTNK